MNSVYNGVACHFQHSSHFAACCIPGTSARIAGGHPVQVWGDSCVHMGLLMFVQVNLRECAQECGP